MELGNFSVGLVVRDIYASHAFYEKLGFTPLMGDKGQNWLILRNGDAIIGLFQGMFERNVLTFNPGWDKDARPLVGALDVRDLQRELRTKNIEFLSEADETTTGPASMMIVDPDGNVINFDQHV